ADGGGGGGGGEGGGGEGGGGKGGRGRGPGCERPERAGGPPQERLRCGRHGEGRADRASGRSPPGGREGPPGDRLQDQGRPRLMSRGSGRLRPPASTAPVRRT